jgi:hypothetical protein
MASSTQPLFVYIFCIVFLYVFCVSPLLGWRYRVAVILHGDSTPWLKLQGTEGVCSAGELAIELLFLTSFPRVFYWSSLSFGPAIYPPLCAQQTCGAMAVVHIYLRACCTWLGTVKAHGSEALGHFVQY